MPPIPVLGPREVGKAFQRLGWEVARQRGRHVILVKSHDSLVDSRAIQIDYILASCIASPSC